MCKLGTFFYFFLGARARPRYRGPRRRVSHDVKIRTSPYCTAKFCTVSREHSAALFMCVVFDRSFRHESHLHYGCSFHSLCFVATPDSFSSSSPHSTGGATTKAAVATTTSTPFRPWRQWRFCCPGSSKTKASCSSCAPAKSLGSSSSRLLRPGRLSRVLALTVTAVVVSAAVAPVAAAVLAA